MKTDLVPGVQPPFYDAELMRILRRAVPEPCSAAPAQLRIGLEAPSGGVYRAILVEDGTAAAVRQALAGFDYVPSAPKGGFDEVYRRSG
jgi:hypothetical protein